MLRLQSMQSVGELVFCMHAKLYTSKRGRMVFEQLIYTIPVSSRSYEQRQNLIAVFRHLSQIVPKRTYFSQRHCSVLHTTFQRRNQWYQDLCIPMDRLLPISCALIWARHLWHHQLMQHLCTLRSCQTRPSKFKVCMNSADKKLELQGVTLDQSFSCKIWLRFTLTSSTETQ